MRQPLINLATRPFENARPLRRAVTLLWLLAVVLLAANAALYYLNSVGTGRKADALAETDRNLAAEQQRIADLEQELAGFDLRRQNETVSFLNGKIDERTFAWSRFFDQLGAVLPADARVLMLAPSRNSGNTGGVRRSAEVFDPDQPFRVGISGISKNDEAVRDLIDGMFAHDSFDFPNLEREDRRKDGQIRFDLNVDYYPQRAVEAAAEPEPSATAAEVVAERQELLLGGDGE